MAGWEEGEGKLNPITEFKGDYRFLSNFYPSPIHFHNVTWPTAEHAYQAMKSTKMEDREKVAKAGSPGDAKRVGKTLTLRPDWDIVKREFMLDIVTRKFWTHKELRDKLLATGDAELVEGNYWNDTFWGVCRGKGENHLGKILMAVRQEIRDAY